MDGGSRVRCAPAQRRALRSLPGRRLGARDGAAETALEPQPGLRQVQPRCVHQGRTGAPGLRCGRAPAAAGPAAARGHRGRAPGAAGPWSLVKETTLSDESPYLLRAATIAGKSGEFSHPWNPKSRLIGARLGTEVGLKRTGVSLARIPPGHESFIYHSHQREEE